MGRRFSNSDIPEDVLRELGLNGPEQFDLKAANRLVLEMMPMPEELFKQLVKGVPDFVKLISGAIKELGDNADKHVGMAESACAAYEKVAKELSSVIQSGQLSSEQAQQALDKLCEIPILVDRAHERGRSGLKLSDVAISGALALVLGLLGFVFGKQIKL